MSCSKEFNKKEIIQDALANARKDVQRLEQALVYIDKLHLTDFREGDVLNYISDGITSEHLRVVVLRDHRLVVLSLNGSGKVLNYGGDLESLIEDSNKPDSDWTYKIIGNVHDKFKTT